MLGKSKIVYLVLLSLISQQLISQSLYSARGYWEESTKPNFFLIQKKIEKGDSLTRDERSYYADYGIFLKNYFDKLSETEKQKYEQFKDRWNEELGIAAKPSNESPEIFEVRGRDRLTNIAYGYWYGISLSVAAGVEAPGSVGIPFITAGLWGIGPALNTKKYTGITRATIRAGNTGRLLGLFYGGSLGLMIGGNDSEKLIFGLSSISSIGLGEAAFYAQKKNQYSLGYVDLMRHYGLLGSWVGYAATFSTGASSTNLTGASFLAGGVAGLLIGSREAKKYDYSRGDVDAITSLTNITTGLGIATLGEVINDKNNAQSLILIPALSSIAGTVIGQREVKGVHLTDRQGTIINLTSGGAALIGLGAVILAKSSSAAINIGIPSGLALIGHQIMFKKFKKENFGLGLKKASIKKPINFSMNLTPENYLLNKTLPLKNYTPEVACKMQGSMVSLRFTF